MTRTLVLALVIALAAGAADAAKQQCKDPKTGKFIKCPPPSSAVFPSAPKGAPHCTTGIPCGSTCIAKGKVCHKH